MAQKVSCLGIQNSNTQPFFKIATWNFAHIFIGKCFYTYIPFFENSKNFLSIFEKQFFMIIFPNFKIFTQKIEIRDSSLIVMFNLHVLLKANQFYLENCTRGDDSRAPLFSLPKSGENVVTATSFTTDLSEPCQFLLSGCVKLMPGRVCKVWWRYLISFFF